MTSGLVTLKVMVSVCVDGGTELFKKVSEKLGNKGMGWGCGG